MLQKRVSLSGSGQSVRSIRQGIINPPCLLFWKKNPIFIFKKPNKPSAKDRYFNSFFINESLNNLPTFGKTGKWSEKQWIVLSLFLKSNKKSDLLKKRICGNPIYASGK